MLPLPPPGPAPKPLPIKTVETQKTLAIETKDDDDLSFDENEFESPKTLDLLIDLDSDDFNTRNKAINELSKNKDEALFNALVKVVAKSEGVLRQSSIKVLGGLNNIQAAYSLAPLLKEEDTELVLDAIDALENLLLTINERNELELKKNIDSKHLDFASQALIECLKKYENTDEHYYLSLSAALILGHLGKTEASEILVGCLGNSSEKMRNRKQAKDALSNIKDIQTLEKVAVLLSDKYPMRTREYAGEVVNNLAKLGVANTSTTDALVTCLKDYDNRLRRIASEALGNVKDVRTIDNLVEALEKDNDPTVSTNAAFAISKMDKVQGIPALYKVFSTNNNSRIKYNVLEALTSTNHHIIVPALLVAIKDFSLGHEAKERFQSLSNEVLNKGLNKLLEDSNPKNRFYAIVSLSQTNDSRVIPHIVRRMVHPDEELQIRRLGEEVLRSLPGDIVKEGLEKCKSDSNEMVQSYAKEYLVEIKIKDTKKEEVTEGTA